MNSITLPSQSVRNNSQFSDYPINKKNQPVIAFRNPNESCYSDKYKNSPVRRGVEDEWMALDPFQQMVMANLADVLADLKWFLQPRQAGELVRGNEYGPKPLAEIRWFLTAPEDGGELLCELAGLVVWPAYRERALNLLDRAEEINPHLASQVWEYLVQPIGEDEDDGEEWVVPILPDLGDGGRRAYAGRLVNLAPPRAKKPQNGSGGKSTHNITVSPNKWDNGLLFPLPEKGERRARRVVHTILTVSPNKSGLVQGELFGEGELK